MALSLNNMLVAALRQGHAATVDSLASLGQGPFTVLDWVQEADASTDLLAPPEVTSRSIWFWVHQAPTPDASRRCWHAWVFRELTAMDDRSRLQRMDQMLTQALEAAIESGNAEPLLDSWECMQDFSAAAGLGTRHAAMLQTLSAALSQHGDGAANLLVELHGRGLVSPSDAHAWSRDPGGAWGAAARGHPLVLEFLLALHPQPTAPLLFRLREGALQALSTIVAGGFGAWEATDLGSRLLDCLDAIARHADANALQLPRCPTALMASLAPAADWPGATASRLHGMRFGHAFEPASPRPARSSRI